jgi:hypothetical protein
VLLHSLAILAALAGKTAHAFYIEVGPYEYLTPDPGGGFAGSLCQIYGADTQDDAINYMVANQDKNSKVSSLEALHDCKSLYVRSTNQLGGYWADHGWVNYDDGTTHYSCYIDSDEFYMDSGGCDAGEGQASVLKKRINRLGGAEL